MKKNRQGIKAQEQVCHENSALPFPVVVCEVSAWPSIRRLPQQLMMTGSYVNGFQEPGSGVSTEKSPLSSRMLRKGWHEGVYSSHLHTVLSAKLPAYVSTKDVMI